MFEIFVDSIGLALVVIFIINLENGVLFSFGTWENEIKDIYHLSQTQGKKVQYNDL